MLSQFKTSHFHIFSKCSQYIIFQKWKNSFILASLSFSFESFGFRKLGILNRNCWWNLEQMWRNYKICEQGTPLPWTLLELYTKYPIPQRLVSLCLLNFKPRKRKEHASFCFKHNKIDNAFICHPLKPDARKLNAKNCGDTDKIKGIPITFIKT